MGAESDGEQEDRRKQIHQEESKAEAVKIASRRAASTETSSRRATWRRRERGRRGGQKGFTLSHTTLRPSSLHFQTVCSHLDMEFSEVRSLGDRTVLKLRLGCDTAGKVWCNVELKQLFVSEIIRRDKRSSPVTWWTFFTVDLSFWEPSLGPPILQQQCQRSPPGCC